MKKISLLFGVASHLIPFVTIFTFTFTASASSDSDKETLYEQLTRGVVRLEEHQSICTPGLKWSNERNVPVGTGFFLQDRHNGNSTFFLITARHVVEKKADLFARVQISRESNKYAILNLPRNLWVFHPSEIKGGYLPIDVAVMQIPPTGFIKSFRYCETDEDCGTDKKKNKPNISQLIASPDVMERAIFFGFPGGDVAKESLEPFARAGVVAYTAFNPNFRIGGKLMPGDSIYYIDSPSFPGNSGGPVLREPLPLRREIYLWGLVTGGNRIGRDYTIVTRPEKILETIQHARKIAKMNESAWIKFIPELPIKCESDK